MTKQFLKKSFEFPKLCLTAVYTRGKRSVPLAEKLLSKPSLTVCMHNASRRMQILGPSAITLHLTGKHTW